MVAERVGFEPTCPLLAGKTLSRRPRYDHFGTSPRPLRKSRQYPLCEIPAQSPIVLLKSHRSLGQNLLQWLDRFISLRAQSSAFFGERGKTLSGLRHSLRQQCRAQLQLGDSAWGGSAPLGSNRLRPP